MVKPAATLGTILRRLVELLDQDVEAVYAAAGLAWRPRYTPIIRALTERGPASIRALADEIGVSHSAISQTVSQMAKEELVELRPGLDARERIVAPTARVEAMMPALRVQWAATNAAAAELDAELSAPLSAVAAEAIESLTRRPFRERIRLAAERLTEPTP